MKNLVLLGFMGTGKSVVGQAAATRLGMRFVDTDDLIEQRAGKTIAQIFSEFGETYFRQEERSVIQQVAAATDQVIATGGGVVLNPANLKDLGSGGVLVCLRADPEVILRRVAAMRHRPLLETADRRHQIENLLREREPLYRAIAWQVDNTHTTVEQDVESVIRIYRDQTAGA